MINKIKEICASGALCGVYTNVEDTGKYMVGYIVACNENNSFLRLVDPYGKYDGIIWLDNDEIYRLETETKYILSLAKLVAHYNDPKVSCKKAYTFDEMIKEIHDEKRICNVELCESDCDDITGFITGVTDSSVEVEQIDKNGEIDGRTVVEKCVISRISFDGTDDVKLEILTERNGRAK